MARSPEGWAAGSSERPSKAAAPASAGAHPLVVFHLEAQTLRQIDAVPLWIEDAALGHVAAVWPLVSGPRQLGRHAVHDRIHVLHDKAEVSQPRPGVDRLILGRNLALLAKLAD